MGRFGWFLAILLGSQLVFADVAGTAKNWFETKYAPNYIQPITNRPEELQQYYVEDNWYLSAEEGNFKSSNSAEGFVLWWNDRLSSGWNGSTLEQIEAQELNPTTVLLRVRWSESVGDESIDSCYTYIATSEAGSWRFATVIDTSCADLF